MDHKPGRRRRRTHSAEFKAEAVAACHQPDASIAACALEQRQTHAHGHFVIEVVRTSTDGKGRLRRQLDSCRRKRPICKLRDCFASLIRSEMSVAKRHRYRAVSEQIADGVQRYTLLDETRGEVMAQIVPAEVMYVRALEQVPPRRLETQRNIDLVRFRAISGSQERHIGRHIVEFDNVRREPALNVDPGAVSN